MEAAVIPHEQLFAQVKAAFPEITEWKNLPASRNWTSGPWSAYFQYSWRVTYIAEGFLGDCGDWPTLAENKQAALQRWIDRCLADNMALERESERMKLVVRNRDKAYSTAAQLLRDTARLLATNATLRR
jgi:hypothetical protein